MVSRQKKFTINELLKWTNLKTINPKSGRKIKQSGKIYKSLQKAFLKNFKDNINPLDSTDNKDPVSQDDIWLYDESNKKIYGSIPPERLVIYQEGNFIRCFDANSLLMMKKNNMTSHPISSKIIPEEAFQKAGFNVYASQVKNCFRTTKEKEKKKKDEEQKISSF